MKLQKSGKCENKQISSSLQQVLQGITGCENVPKGVDKVSTNEQIHSTTGEM